MSRLLPIHIRCLGKLTESDWLENWTFSRHVHQKLIDKGFAKRATGTLCQDGIIRVNTLMIGRAVTVYKRTVEGSLYILERSKRKHRTERKAAHDRNRLPHSL